MRKLSFVCLIAYDWKYSFESIASYYSIADEIILGIDINRKTWSGNSFELPQEFFDKIKAMDPESKIVIYEDDFNQEMHPMDNDVAERTYLANKCKEGNWVVQIDADEVVQDPEMMKEQILQAPEDAQIRINWKTIFKTLPEGLLVISPESEDTTIASLERNSYRTARVTNQPGYKIGGFLLHNSWGRTREELYTKLTNWSHALDFPTDQYMKFWDSITIDSYKDAKNFHPLDRVSWASLVLLEKRVG